MKLTVTYDEARELIKELYGKKDLIVEFVDQAVIKSYRIMLYASDKKEAAKEGNKIALIKAIKGINQMGLAEAKAESEGETDTVLVANISRSEVESIRTSNSGVRKYLKVEPEYAAPTTTSVLDF